MNNSLKREGKQMAHTNNEPSGRIILRDNTRFRGNSEYEDKVFLKVNENKSLTLDVIESFDDGYNFHKSRDNSRRYEIKIDELIRLIIENGTQV